MGAVRKAANEPQVRTISGTRPAYRSEQRPGGGAASEEDATLHREVGDLWKANPDDSAECTLQIPAAVIDKLTEEMGTNEQNLRPTVPAPPMLRTLVPKKPDASKLPLRTEAPLMRKEPIPWLIEMPMVVSEPVVRTMKPLTPVQIILVSCAGTLLLLRLAWAVYSFLTP